MILEWIAAIFLILGSLFMMVAAIGVVKFDDVYMRMHAITKAASLGAILMLTSVSLLFTGWLVLLEAFLVVLFIILTTPLATQMISKSSHISNMPKGEGYITDELEDKEIEQGEKLR